MFEDRKNLLNKMAAGEPKAGPKRFYARRAEESQIHIERIRAIMLAPAAMNLAVKQG
jgi:two-component system chemotaxis response regulator CheB